MGKRKADLNVKQSGVGEHSDPQVSGLLLLVRPSTAKGREDELRRSWAYRFTLDGKRQKIGLGAYPALSLADAREAARKAAALVAKGVSPIEARRARSAPENLKFLDAVEAHLAGALPRFKSDKSRHALTHALRVHCAPLHNKPILQIGTRDIAGLLNAIAKSTPQRAEAVRTALRGVFAYAALELEDRGHALRNPMTPDLLRAAHYVPKGSDGHHPALADEDAPEFLRALRAITTADALLLEFTILTVARAGAARLARFEQIDIEKLIWRVPRGQLKSARFFAGEHFRVPLASRALEIVEEARQRASNASPSSFIFSGSETPPNDMRTINLMRRMCRSRSWVDESSGRWVSTHGFRTSFRSWAHKTKRDRAATEVSLGHRYFGEVEARYLADDLLEERRKLLDEWASYCAGHSAEVIPLRREQ